MKFPVHAAFAGLVLMLSVLASAAEAQAQATIPVQPVRYDPNPRPALHPGATYISAQLSALPSDEDIQASWPAAALKQQVEGFAAVDCLVKADGSLNQCEIESEGPPGYGYGAATAAMFVKYVRVDVVTIPGGLRPNSRVLNRWKWQFP